MTYKQAIVENIGVGISEFLPGYSHNDGLRFDPQDPIHQMMETMVPFLIEAHQRVPIGNLKYILDVGSGAGSLAYFLKKYDPNLIVFTLDGNQETINSPFINKDTHFIVRTDQKYKLVDENEEIIKFDLIVCFEHIEHIQESNFRQFLKNIQIHAHKNTIFIGTAANWKYESEDEKHVHCNVKNESEWRYYLKANEDLFNGFAAIDAGPWIAHAAAKDRVPSSSPEIIKSIFKHFFSETEEDADYYDQQEAWSHRVATSTIIILGYG